MSAKKKAVFNWSGGKDSALALYKVLQGDEYDVVALLTTISSETSSSSIHSIPIGIIEDQAKSIGIPLYPVMLPKEFKGYDKAMKEVVAHFKEEGVYHFIFGDIFLYDVKSYRESMLNPFGVEVVEPLWNKTSKEIIKEYLDSGIRAKIIVTQADKLDSTYIGKELDSSFINSLPADVDCCGENGEYHTLTYDGPLFKKEIKFTLSETKSFFSDITLDDASIKRFYYWQADVMTF